ncbi:MAG: succinate dehydrogenase assembly factor 4 [Gammaproteobacteria bacterium]|jgi:hypothetical protein
MEHSGTLARMPITHSKAGKIKGGERSDATGPTDAPKPGRVAEPPVRRSLAAGDRPQELGGQKGPDPTRYGDWERNGRCIDF